MYVAARVFAFTVVGVLASGCVTPAPGTAQVKITHSPAGVSSCTLVSNIGATDMDNLDPLVA
jgi:hypothetical protein